MQYYTHNGTVKLMLNIVVKLCQTLLLASLLSFGSTVNADIINPNPIELTQPDRTRIQLRFKGTGILNWYEDLEGFPVQRINGTWYYQQAVDPNVRLGPLLEVGKVDPKTRNVRRIPPIQRELFFQANNPGVSLTMPGQANNAVQPVPPVGGVDNLVILIRFSDHTNRTLPAQANFDTLFNSVGGDPTYAPTGSIRDIYLENSYGQLTLNSTIVDWYTTTNTESYYADGESALLGNLEEALVEALNNADNAIDFSQYDSDSDGVIDAITFVHSGYAAEFGGIDAYGASTADRVWSHKASISTWTSTEGVTVSDYNINPGVWSTSGSAIGRVGVIAHELGHFFGLPDLYDYTNPGEGIGSWGLMANSWGFTGTQLNPPHMSAWSKIELGWTTPTIISSSGSYSINEAEFNSEVFRINQGYSSGEYLLIENRQPSGIESTIPQGGLAIFHIDESRGNHTQSYPGQSNWPNDHYQVALKQADNIWGLEKGTNRGDSGDLYHSGGVNSIDDTSSPSTQSYATGNLLPSSNLISNISASGSTMTFDYLASTPPPEPTFVDPAGGETYAQGSIQTALWNANGAVAGDYYDVYLMNQCAPVAVFSEDVEGGTTQFSFTNNGSSYNWQQDTNNPYAGTGNFHATNPGVTSDQYLTSGLISLGDNPVLSLYHSYDLEFTWDGGVIEVSADGVSWVDMGSSITSGGYNSFLTLGTTNPLSGRNAFTGSSNGYIQTTVDLDNYAASDIYIRFRLGSDGVIGATGWDVDSIEVSSINAVTQSFLGNISIPITSLAWNVVAAPGADYCLSLDAANSYGNAKTVFSNLFSITAAGLTCNGLPVSVDLNLGQTTGPGDDVVLGTPFNDDIRGKAGNDTICGMGGDDFIHGNSGDDWIDGGDGVDNLRGGQGADTIYAGTGATVGVNSRVFGGFGDDFIYGGPDADDLRGGKGADTVYGDEGDDEINGNDDDDYLVGEEGNDKLKGGNGENDELYGSTGDDELNGGSGVNDLCDGGVEPGDILSNCEL